MQNGALLSHAATEFDALITVDKNLPYQQNLKTLPLAVVVLDAHSNALPALLPLMANLMSELSTLTPIGKTMRDIDANEVIWQFFAKHRR